MPEPAREVRKLKSSRNSIAKAGCLGIGLRLGLGWEVAAGYKAEAGRLGPGLRLGLASHFVSVAKTSGKPACDSP